MSISRSALPCASGVHSAERMRDVASMASGVSPIFLLHLVLHNRRGQHLRERAQGIRGRSQG